MADQLDIIRTIEKLHWRKVRAMTGQILFDVVDSDQARVISNISSIEADLVLTLRDQRNALLTALERITEQSESYCKSVGHLAIGSASYGLCDDICDEGAKARKLIKEVRGESL